jgi:hypothetical protein
LCLGFVVLTALAINPAAAQVFTGRIDVTVVDSTGAVLPGANVEISGPQNRSAVSDANGEAHFLNLAPGTYAVSAMMQGFSDYKNQNVPVGAGVAVPLRATLSVGGVAQQVEVTAETPVVDVNRQTTQTNVSLDELQNIPTARDPWVVMQTVPSIMVDRVNVGGSESGQQSNYGAKGADGADNTWNIDGIPITDMAATGASPTYYDFDMFQEMQVTTGGADAQNPTAGVQLNFVLKSGSNTPHGSTRVFFENESMQSTNMPSDLAETIGGASGKGNRTSQYSDYGFEIGGPIVKDHLWGWGSVGKTDVRILTLTDVIDSTILKNYAAKFTYQVNPTWRFGYTFFEGDKVKHGRGASATRPQETTWNQSGPSYVNKFEANVVAGSRFFLTLRGAHMPMGFGLHPIGGMDTPAYRDVNRVWHGSYLDFQTDRPQDAVLGDVNMFRGNHEIKAGFSWRKSSVDSVTSWPGNGFYSLHRNSYPTDGLMLGVGLRPRRAITEGKYYGAYVGDTITFDRMTLNLAVRWDRATGSALESAQGALPAIPDIVPAVTFPAISNAIVYNYVSPRVGMSYSLDENRKTILRASYASFASQLGSADASFVTGLGYAYIYYFAVDANHNGATDPEELTDFAGSSSFDPDDPLSTVSYNKADDDLNSPRTHEVVVGIDREIRQNLGVSASFTYRRFNKITWQPLIGVNQSDFFVDHVISGTMDPIGSFNGTAYGLPEDRAPAGGGELLQNRPGYHQRFMGFEIQATKRLSNRWMARVGFSTSDHREYFDDPSVAIQDPTRRPDEPLIDGGLVVRETGGSGKSDIYLVSPRYQFVANGLWQGPWGINLGANLLTRQGFAQPFNAGDEDVSDPTEPNKSVLLVDKVDAHRLPGVTTMDVRVEKAFRFGRTNLLLDFDVFNLFNTNTVLGREYDFNAGEDFNQVREIMQPRIARVGLRFNF